MSPNLLGVVAGVGASVAFAAFVFALWLRRKRR